MGVDQVEYGIVNLPYLNVLGDVDIGGDLNVQGTTTEVDDILTGDLTLGSPTVAGGDITAYQDGVGTVGLLYTGATGLLELNVQGSGAGIELGGDVKLYRSGANELTIPDNIVVTGSLSMTNAAGPSLLDEAATSTNPTVVPNRADPDTGLGWNSIDRVSLIAGSEEILSVRENGTGGNTVFIIGDTVESGNVNQMTLDIISTLNDAGAPGTNLFNLIKGNLTETDITGWATVNLIDLQVDAVSKFTVDRTGAMVLAAGATLAGTLAMGTNPISGATSVTATSFVIGANTLDTGEFAFLDGLDQSLAQADSPTFAVLNLSGDLTIGGNDAYGANAAAQSFTIHASAHADHDSALHLDGGNNGTGGNGAIISVYGEGHASLPGDVYIRGSNGANKGDIVLQTSGNSVMTVSPTVVTWATVTHTGLVLSGALDVGGQVITNAPQIEINEGGGFDGPNVDDNFFKVRVRDNASGLVEIFRWQGAADPYAQATLPMVFLPIATASLPATAVEGMFTYDATLNKMVMYNGAAWETITSA